MSLYLPYGIGLFLMFLGVSGYAAASLEAVYGIYTGVFVIMGINWYVKPQACRQLQEFNSVSQLKRSKFWRENLGVPEHRAYSIVICAIFVLAFSVGVSPIALGKHYGEDIEFSAITLCIITAVLAIPSFFLFSWKNIEKDLTFASIALRWYCLAYVAGLAILRYSHSPGIGMSDAMYFAFSAGFLALVLHGSYKTRVDLVQKQINEDRLKDTLKS